MKKVWLSVAVGAVALLSAAPAEAAHRTRRMVMPGNMMMPRHMTPLFRSRLARFDRALLGAAVQGRALTGAFTAGALSRGPFLSSMPLGGRFPAQLSSMPVGAGLYPMGMGGYGGYPMGYGGYGMSSMMPYGGGSSMSTGGYGSPSSAPAQSSEAQKAPVDSVEVSGPLDVPPPHRAVIRVRLPWTWADVYINGRKVDTMGKSRTYVTPELSGPRNFEVIATSNDKGQTLRLQGLVTVDAGQIRTLDFTSRK